MLSGLVRSPYFIFLLIRPISRTFVLSEKMSDSEYDEYMQRAKQYANNGQLKKSLKALLAAKEINDNDKVRRRIAKIQVNQKFLSLTIVVFYFFVVTR